MSAEPPRPPMSANHKMASLLAFNGVLFRNLAQLRAAEPVGSRIDDAVNEYLDSAWATARDSSGAVNPTRVE